VYDDKGFLKIVDRKKDMIIVSGFNVYPNEIEAVATGLPRCQRVRLRRRCRREVGRGGEALRRQGARRRTRRGRRRDALPQGADGYKVPKIVRFVDALPKSTVGKILRRELRD
jgi:long-chain acyl-CoA synthetase